MSQRSVRKRRHRYKSDGRYSLAAAHMAVRREAVSVIIDDEIHPMRSATAGELEALRYWLERPAQ